MWLDAIFLKYRQLRSAGVTKPQRGSMNFTGVVVTDDAPNDQTTVAVLPLTDTSITGESNSNKTALIMQINYGGTISIQRVLVGAPDSGGTGYRMLRVEN
jgi:hypothetical protein